METPWKWQNLCLGLLFFQLCNALPINLENTVADSHTQLLTGLVAVLLTVCSVVFLAGCLCCQRRNGFKEFRDSPVVASTSSNLDHGHINPVANGEFTIFTPLSPPHQNNNVFLANQQIIARTPDDYSYGDVDVSSWFNGTDADFPRIKLKYIREIGKGWFGRVVEGAAQDIKNEQKWTPVAVRILEATASSKERVVFLHDASIYRCGEHPNILQLLGRCLDTVPLLLLQEFCPQGDLKNYLRQNKQSTEKLLSSEYPLVWCCQLTSALKHLHENNLIHPDLATRNCQVTTTNLVLKLGDYGLAVFQYPQDYYLGAPGVPVRWCAPESLEYTSTTIQPKKITQEANIWSLAVTLWEICECGEQPYSDLTDDEVIAQVLGSCNVRLGRPSYTGLYTDYIFRLMQLCWTTSESRPAVAQIDLMLTDLLQVHKNTSSVKTVSVEDFDKRWKSFKPNTIVKTDNQVIDCGGTIDNDSEMVVTKQLSPSLNNLHGSLDNLLDDSSEPQMESWLENVATKTGDLSFVRGLSDAIKDLDNTLALENASSSDSSHQQSPAPDTLKNKPKIEFKLGPVNHSNKFIESPIQNDSLTDSILFIQRNSSGSETEEENWKTKIERGAYTEKVRQKSRSVADLMILTHIDCSESESETPLPSLDYRINYYKNVRYAPKNLENVSLMFGSEGNLLNVQDTFQEELKKLQEERKDSLLFVPENRSQPSLDYSCGVSGDVETIAKTVPNWEDSPSKRIMQELNSTTDIKPANQVFNVFNVTIDKFSPVHVNNAKLIRLINFSDDDDDDLVCCVPKLSDIIQNNSKFVNYLNCSERHMTPIKSISNSDGQFNDYLSLETNTKLNENQNEKLLNLDNDCEFDGLEYSKEKHINKNVDKNEQDVLLLKRHLFQVPKLIDIIQDNDELMDYIIAKYDDDNTIDNNINENGDSETLYLINKGKVHENHESNNDLFQTNVVEMSVLSDETVENEPNELHLPVQETPIKVECTQANENYIVKELQQEYDNYKLNLENFTSNGKSDNIPIIIINNNNSINETFDKTIANLENEITDTLCELVNENDNCQETKSVLEIKETLNEKQMVTEQFENNKLNLIEITKDFLFKEVENYEDAHFRETSKELHTSLSFENMRDGSRIHSTTNNVIEQNDSSITLEPPKLCQNFNSIKETSPPIITESVNEKNATCNDDIDNQQNCIEMRDKNRQNSFVNLLNETSKFILEEQKYCDAIILKTTTNFLDKKTQESLNKSPDVIQENLCECSCKEKSDSVIKSTGDGNDDEEICRTNDPEIKVSFDLSDGQEEIMPNSLTHSNVFTSTPFGKRSIQELSLNQDDVYSSLNLFGADRENNQIENKHLYSLETWDNFLGKTLDSQDNQEKLFHSFSLEPQSLLFLENGKENDESPTNTTYTINEKGNATSVCNNNKDLDQFDSFSSEPRSFLFVENEKEEDSLFESEKANATYNLNDKVVDIDDITFNLDDDNNKYEDNNSSCSWESNGGWFLHPQLNNGDVSGEMTIPQNTDTYVGFNMDDEIMAAIRNELLTKLPQAQGVSNDKVDDDDEEMDLGDKKEVFLRYNVYNTPLSPIPEESVLEEQNSPRQQESDNEDSDWSEQCEPDLHPDTESHSVHNMESSKRHHQHTLSQDSCCSNDTLFNLEELAINEQDPDNVSTFKGKHDSDDREDNAIIDNINNESETVIESYNDNEMEKKLDYNIEKTYITDFLNGEREASLTETIKITETSDSESPSSATENLLPFINNNNNNNNNKQVAPLPSPEDKPWKQLPASLLSYDKISQSNNKLLPPVTESNDINNESRQLSDNLYENCDQHHHTYENMNRDNNCYDNLSDMNDIYNEADYVNIVNLENTKNSAEYLNAKEIEGDELRKSPDYGNSLIIEEEHDVFGVLTDIRFSGPSDNQLMTTSFSESNDLNDEQDWDSGSDTRSSSSGEFIWKEGEHEESLKALRAAPQDVMDDVKPMEGIQEETSSESSDSDEEGESPEFVPSAWDKYATPTKSALRSPEKTLEKNDKKKTKGVWFKKQKYHCVYEYPREPESPVLHNFDLWEPHQDYSSFADWELDTADPYLPPEASADDFSQNYYRPKTNRNLNLYQLSSIQDFNSSTTGMDDEFFISSSAKPFDMIGGLSSQFFPGSSQWNDLLKAGDNITPDSGVEDGTPANEFVLPVKCVQSLKTLASNVMKKCKKVEEPTMMGGLRHTRNKLKLDLPPSPSAFTSTKMFTVEPILLDPVMNREKPTFTTFGKSRFLVQHVDTPPDDETTNNKNVSFEALPYKPMQKHIFIKDFDDDDNKGKGKVEMVRGEASLLDSADEDSGIESCTLERKMSATVE